MKLATESDLYLLLMMMMMMMMIVYYTYCMPTNLLSTVKPWGCFYLKASFNNIVDYYWFDSLIYKHKMTMTAVRI